jgi:hypothetical protein
VFDARESGRATPYAGNSLEFIDSNYSRSSKVHLEKRKLINTYVNDYQIISNKGEVKEQRKLLERSVKETGNQNTLLRLDTFISKGIALLPVSLFAARNQEKFHFLLLKHEEIGGVKTAVIECIPKNPARVNSIFGTLWVDLQDFSLVRMSVNPVSIGGYENMLSLAERLDAKPLLYCRIDFGKKSQGIRFPTSVQIREKYSGGAQVRSMTGKGSWERSKTQFTFDDYKFFTVSSDSREENVTD